MSTILELEADENVLRLIPKNDFVASSVETYRDSMLEAIGGQQRATILDLSAVKVVDSLGINLIVGLYKSCQRNGTEFSVEGVNENILRIFKFFKLSEFFVVEKDLSA